MKKYLSILLPLYFCFFSISNPLYAECVYEQALKAEELPVGVRLSWSTSYENNTSVFVLEKIDNSQDFQAVGILQAAGNSKGIKEYRFLDMRALSNKISYRIKQVDVDGSFSYSNVFTLNKKTETNIMLTDIRNDASKKSCNFTIEAFKEGNVNVTLLDEFGAVVWEGVKKVTNGVNEFSVDLSAQPEGEYQVIASMGKDRKVMAVNRTFDEVERASNVAGRKKQSKN